MTRMQKWESYRQEIDQSSQVGQTIASQDQLIARYKKEIDKINPAILSNIPEVNLNMHKGVSEVIVSQNQIPSQITKLFKDVNKAKTPTNRNTISTILFNLKNETILNDNKKLKDEWLNGHADYVQLAGYVAKANQNTVKDKEFEKDLHTKYENLATTKTETQIGSIIPLSKTGQKNIGHHVFVIAIAISAVFFILIFVLLLVRIFGGN